MTTIEQDDFIAGIEDALQYISYYHPPDFIKALGDAYSHANHYDIPFAEAIVTGVISGLLALAGSYLFEDRARRIRAIWSKLFG